MNSSSSRHQSASVKDSRATLSRLFASVNGYVTEPSDDRRLLTRSAVYGELTPEGAGKLVDSLQLTEQDVFYDLGSGVGRVVLQVAISAPIRKCVGIELISSRYRAARRVLRAARAEGLIQCRTTSLRCGNFLASRISDATVVYACSTCFSSHLMVQMARKLARLNKDLTLVTLQDLDQKHRGFQFVRTLRLKTTWSRSAEAHIYRVHRQRNACAVKPIG